MYKLLWADLFEHDGLPDTNIWQFETGGHGFGNGEAQYYTDRIDNAYVKKGILYIEAKKEKYQNNDYTSAKLVTYGKKPIMHGKIEVMAQIPTSHGSWPAIWLLSNAFKEGTRWPLCGEIDMMEHVGNHPGFVHFSLHTDYYHHIKNTQYTHVIEDSKLLTGFHEYAITWDESEISFLLDKQVCATFHKGENGHDNGVSGWPFNQPFYLILNVALGGSWGGLILDQELPATMAIKYVKVYERCDD